MGRAYEDPHQAREELMVSIRVARGAASFLVPLCRQDSQPARSSRLFRPDVHPTVHSAQVLRLLDKVVSCRRVRRWWRGRGAKCPAWERRPIVDSRLVALFFQSQQRRAVCSLSWNGEAWPNRSGMHGFPAEKSSAAPS